MSQHKEGVDYKYNSFENNNLWTSDRTVGRDESQISATGRPEHPRRTIPTPLSLLRLNRRSVPEYIGGENMDMVATVDSTINYYVRGIDGLVQHSNKSLKTISCGPRISESPATSRWIWKVKALPDIPQHVPLEWTSLHIDKVPLDIITSRLSDFFRVNSISCFYPVEEPGRVICHTCTCIKFVIQLWRSENGGALLEMQRRRGCCVAFQYLRKYIYKSVTSETTPTNCCELQLRRPSKELQQRIRHDLYDDKDERPRTHRRCFDGQRACLDMLESVKVDERRLGIEFLLGLTESVNESSECVARALVYDEGRISKRLRLSFLNCLCPTPSYQDEICRIQSPGFDVVDDPCMLEIPYYIQQATMVSHLLALKALGNCLASIISYEQDYLTNETNKKLLLWTPFWSRVLGILVQDLHQASRYPQEAASSAKCLRLLENLLPEMVAPLIDQTIAPILELAHKFGQDHHLTLERESGELLKCYSQGSGSKATSLYHAMKILSQRASHYIVNRPDGECDSSTFDDTLYQDLAFS